MTQPPRKDKKLQPAANPLHDLFPPQMPYSTGFLQVDDLHTLYWEQCGNPDGVPVILFHGGPGAGATPAHRRFFDPNHYRIVIFDQRGCGRSNPLGELRQNDTARLVDDIEKLRRHLRIDAWHLFGGSWGSTLALHYAARNPNRCLSLTLFAIFLMEQPEIDWFFGGIRKFFPEAWEKFAAAVDCRDPSRLLDTYYAILTGGDEKRRSEAAVAWRLYEGSCSQLVPKIETVTSPEQRLHALAMASIEAHYFKYEARRPEHSLLNSIDALRTIPATIIQGRYDVICPLESANRLHLAWPEADYVIVPDAGHSALDPGIRSRLIEATENTKSIR